MFEKLEKIGQDIYVYKNFLSKENLQEYENIIKDITENDWIDATTFNKPTLHTYGRHHLGKILKKIQDDLLPEGYYLEHTPSINRMKLGMGMDVHSDDCPHCKKIKYPDLEITEKEKIRCVKYGIVVYLTRFTGGEIYYPEQGIIFSPNPGDLIMHGTSIDCKHGVKPVVSGSRITMSPYIVEFIEQKDAEKQKIFWENYEYRFE